MGKYGIHFVPDAANKYVGDWVAAGKAAILVKVQSCQLLVSDTFATVRNPNGPAALKTLTRWVLASMGA